MAPHLDVVAGQVVVVIPAGDAGQVARMLHSAGVALRRHHGPGWLLDPRAMQLIGVLQEAAGSGSGTVSGQIRADVLESVRTADEAAEELKVSARRVRTLAEQGELRARRAGAGWLVAADSVTALELRRKGTRWAS